jgi:hypothetical protein
MFTITAHPGVTITVYLGRLPSQHIQVLPSLFIWAVYHHCLSWFQSNHDPISNIIVTTDLDTSLFDYLFILYSYSSLHHPNQLVHLSVPGTSQI